jgi:hypothetical protein
MPDPRAFPDDVAAALERNPEARDRFAALPEQQQVEWLRWIDRARGRRGRDERIQELWVMATAMRDARLPVRVHIFPAKRMAALLAPALDRDLKAFWTTLKDGLDSFERTHVIPD